MNYRKPALYTVIVILSITAFLGFQLRNTKFDFSLTNFYPLNNAETDFFYQYTDTFEWDNDYILIGLESTTPNVFDASFMNDVDSFCNSINMWRP